MLKLNKAFEVFHLEPGVTIVIAKKSYHQFVKRSHPDIMRGAEAKQMAEAYLTEINELFEVLEEHFRVAHSSKPGCYCVKKVKPSTSRLDAAMNRRESEKMSYRTESNTAKATGPTAEQLRAAAEARMKRRQKEAESDTAKSEAVAKKYRDEQAAARIMQEAARQVFLKSMRKPEKP